MKFVEVFETKRDTKKKHVFNHYCILSLKRCINVILHLVHNQMSQRCFSE